jgi:hypothetical protein
MMALVVRSAIGMTVAPTLDFVRGKDVTVRDYLPFGHATQSGYDLNAFQKDAAYTVVGALVAATPYTTLVGTEVLTASSVSAGTAAAATGALGVAGIAAAGIGTMMYIDSLQPGSPEYKTMSQLAYNIRM